MDPNPAVFNTEKLEWMNAQHLKRLPGGRTRRARRGVPRRARHDLAGARCRTWRATFVRALGDRLRTLADAECYGAFALSERSKSTRRRGRSCVGAGRRGAAAARARRDGSSGRGVLAGQPRARDARAGGRRWASRPANSCRRRASRSPDARSRPGIFDVMWLLGRERAVRAARDAARRWREAQAAASEAASATDASRRGAADTCAEASSR